MSTLGRYIKVLWIDDNPDEFGEFLDDAYDEKIEITVCKDVMSGIQELQNRNVIYEAVILDANCLVGDQGPDEIVHIDALTEAFYSLGRIGNQLPVFVYTAGGYDKFESLNTLIPNLYRRKASDGKVFVNAHKNEQAYYDKPDEEFELFDAIITAVSSSEEHKIIRAYPEAFEVCKNRELLDLIRRMDDPEFDRDETVPNSLRCVADILCDFLKDKQIYPDDFKSSNKIKECSLVFSEDKSNEFVPNHIQNAFYFLSEYLNRGSHGRSETPKRKSVNKLREDIKAGRAKYLNRAALHLMMTLFHWAVTLPFGDSTAMERIKGLSSDYKSEADKKEEQRRQNKPRRNNA